MRCNALGVFALGAFIGTAAAIAVTAMDPATRRRMCCRATRIGRKAARYAENMMK